MDLLSTGTGAHGRGLHRHRHQTHGPTIHHGGRVPHVQEAGAPARTGTAWAGTLVYTDLEHADLQVRLELETEGDMKESWSHGSVNETNI